MRWRGLSIAIITLFVFLQVGTVFSDTNSSSVTVSVVTPECNDGVDNDGDSLADYPADLGCSSLSDNDETNPAILYQCNDSVDNDGDTRTDYPADLGCDSASDDSEAGEITPSTVAGSFGGGGPIKDFGVMGSGQVIFEGFASGGDQLQVLVNGSRRPGLTVGSEGTFSLLVQGLLGDTHLFVLYVKTVAGEITRPQSFAIDVSESLITYVRGINFTSAEARQLRGGCTLGTCRGDLNFDRKVDLVDFSIASYWWKRPLEGDFITVEKKELNGDGKISIEDFSILAYFWTA